MSGTGLPSKKKRSNIFTHTDRTNQPHPKPHPLEKENGCGITVERLRPSQKKMSDGMGTKSTTLGHFWLPPPPCRIRAKFGQSSQKKPVVRTITGVTGVALLDGDLDNKIEDKLDRQTPDGFHWLVGPHAFHCKATRSTAHVG